MDLPPPAAPWHTLLAPLPADAVPRRGPVAPAAITGAPEGAAIAGWEQLTLELSAGTAGLRAVLVVLDQAGQPIAASDRVLYRIDHGAAGDGRTEYRHATIGGRFETDGTFRGTRWHTVSSESAAGEELENRSTPSTPTAADVTALEAIVADILRRAPPPARL
ncbi:MAG: hypothetical protein OEY20_04495 [Gemmatimonadota bacterium]|nr:hypothetical protein [Gemmatimonadota bacterium]MDH5196488.1 hypothetical protein [Gemmatimonadota bacterium]